MSQGNQIITVDYNAIATSDVVNKIGIEARSVGILDGGYVTYSGSNVVSVDPFVCEIRDAGNTGRQIRIQTQSAASIALDPYVSGTNYIVAQWIYTGGIGDWMTISAVRLSAIVNPMLILATVTFDGAGNFSAINYLDKSSPSSFGNFLYVRQTLPTSLSVWVKAGRLSQYKKNYIPDTQLTFVPPPLSGGNTQYRIDLVYIDPITFIPSVVSGIQTTDSTNVVAPPYKGIPLAEIYLFTGQTSIAQYQHITDVRSWLQPKSGFNFITPYEFHTFTSGAGHDNLDWTTIDASAYIPLGASSVLVEGQMACEGPDITNIDSFIELRKSASESNYFLLLRCRSAGTADNVAVGGQGTFPVTSDRKFDFRVRGGGDGGGSEGGRGPYDVHIKLIGYFL